MILKRPGMGPLVLTMMLGGLLLAGCADEIEPASLIARPRVLAARVEPAGDSSRSWPRPAEAATITWLVVTPDATRPRPLSWSLSACVAAAVGGACRDGEAPFLTSTGDSDDGAPPVLAFTVPSEATLGDASRLLITGAICVDGAAVAGAGLGQRCIGAGAVETDVALTVILERAAAQNHAPTLADDPITFDGAVWPGSAIGALPAADCAGAAAALGLPVVAATARDDKRHVEVASDAGDRETIPPPAGAETAASPAREALQLSHFSTGGELDRQFDAVEAADERAVAPLRVDWQPPKPAAVASAGGMAVTFYFVARDLRGGVDWTARSLCVTPAALAP